MPSTRNISRSLLLNMTLLTAAATALVGGLWISAEYSDFNRQSRKMRSELTDARKAMLREKVDEAVQFIEFKRSQTERRTRDMLRERVTEAHAVAMHIHETYKDDLPAERVRSLVREAIRPMRFCGGRGYYFATDMDGVLQLSADRPQMEGTSLIGMTDTEGRTVIGDMIELARTKGEGFYACTWTKPGASGRDFRKLSFVKHFEPFDWFIAAGEYLDDVEKDLQAEALAWINTGRFGDGGYVFVGQWDGLSLTDPQRGENMLHVTDPNGVKIVAELIAQAKAGGGYVSYVMPKFEGQRPDPKISYAAGVADWQWYVGTGVYVDDIEQTIAAARGEMGGHVRGHIGAIIALLALLLVGAHLIARRAANRTRTAFSAFSSFFARAASESTEMAADNLGYAEFEQLAASANQMVRERRAAEVQRDELEVQLRHAQKMEAIGQLAGGVAHDFNNLLTAIMGNAQLLILDLPAGSAASVSAGEIVKASTRAADLTRQLLAFSRKGKLQNTRVNIHEIIDEVVQLLTHSIDRRIEIVPNLIARDPVVLGDPTLLESAMLNLGINARDAMPTGGRLTLATRDVTVNEADCVQYSYEVQPGDYLEISVTDTGIGISADIQQRIFEPFFTTKDPGAGTGLGLAAVDGCIRSHGGMIWVTSEEGEGTTFRILLPHVDETEVPTAPVAPPAAATAGHGSILLVDDEEIVRNVTARQLLQLGYTVHTCTDGADAVEFFRQHHEQIDLVVLDLIMPKLGGADTFARIREIDPNARVVIASGFSRQGTSQALLDQGVLGFLHKPFGIEELAEEVARHLSN